MNRLLIKNGRVVDPLNNVDEIRDIYVENGYIQAVPPREYSRKIFDATGMIVVPGLVDLHVHFREPGFEYKEDILTGSRAVARGGFTTVCCMPNTNPVTDNKEIVEFILRKGKEAGLVNLLVAGALSKGQKGLEHADYPGMAESGAAAFSDDGKTLMDRQLMISAAKQIKKMGLFISDHAENHDANKNGVINEGEVSRKLGLAGISNSVEADIVKRDIKIAKETGCHIHLQHISTEESAALIREAKQDGLPVTAEAAPHHFVLTQDAVLIHGANAKMNPPLRRESDRQAIIEAIKDGTIDAIATDHAPHSCEEKALPLQSAPFGIAGLETAFALSYSTLVLGKYISLMKMIELVSLNPARILGNKEYGLNTGAAADIAVFDINSPYVINKDDFVSKGKNTPFDGKIVYGRTVLTVCGGNITYKWR